VSDFSTDVQEVAKDLGIDLSKADDGSLGPSEVNETEAEASEAEATEEVGAEAQAEENSAKEGSEAQDGKNPEVEAKEAPVEEPKLTHKEFLAIQTEKQALDAERKSFQEEMTKQRQELQEQFGSKVEEYDKFDSFLDRLAQKDPDLFKILQGEFAEHVQHYSNPVVDKVAKEVAELKKELSSYKAKASDEVTLAKLDAEFNSFMNTTGKEAEALGIKVDRKALEDTWAKGGSLEEAFYAKYGKQVVTATKSKLKLETATKTVAAQPKVTTAGSVKRSTVPTTKDYGSMSWDEAARYEMRRVQGKVS
jgi:hypothetical protein